jgi:hypothetical protein
MTRCTSVSTFFALEPGRRLRAKSRYSGAFADPTTRSSTVSQFPFDVGSNSCSNSASRALESSKQACKRTNNSSADRASRSRRLAISSPTSAFCRSTRFVPSKTCSLSMVIASSSDQGLIPATLYSATRVELPIAILPSSGPEEANGAGVVLERSLQRREAGYQNRPHERHAHQPP